MFAEDEPVDETSDAPKNIREYVLVRHFSLGFAAVNRLNILATANFIKTAPCSRLHHVRQFRSARHSLKSVDHCQAFIWSHVSLRMSNHGNVNNRDNCESLRRPSLSVKMQRSLTRMRKSIKKITGNDIRFERCNFVLVFCNKKKSPISQIN